MNEIRREVLGSGRGRVVLRQRLGSSSTDTRGGNLRWRSPSLGWETRAGVSTMLGSDFIASPELFFLELERWLGWTLTPCYLISVSMPPVLFTITEESNQVGKGLNVEARCEGAGT